MLTRLGCVKLYSSSFLGLNLLAGTSSEYRLVQCPPSEGPGKDVRRLLGSLGVRFLRVSALPGVPRRFFDLITVT